MADIASLEVIMGLNSIRYERQLERSRRLSRAAFRRIATAADAATDRFRLLTRAAIAFGTVRIAARAFRITDELSKLARATEFNFDSLQRLQFGFEQAGVSARTFRRSVARSGRVIEDALAGQETYLRALRGFTWS